MMRQMCSAEEVAVTVGGLRALAKQLQDLLAVDGGDVAQLGEEVWELAYGPALLGYLLEFPVVYTTHPRASPTDGNSLGIRTQQNLPYLVLHLKQLFVDEL
jgi:hypothetical protein